MKTLTILLCSLLGLVRLAAEEEPVIRIGMIGLDTSHVTAFTKIINDPTAKGHVPGAKVVAAYKGGSPDIESSISRVDGYTKTLREDYGVEICKTIEDLCTKVDAVMIESVDGRPHLMQAQPVIEAGLPLYLDKPMAGSLRDVLEIFRLAEEAKVPVFSSSSLRYGENTQAVRGGSIGKVVYALCSSPAKLEPNHPDLFLVRGPRLRSIVHRDGNGGANRSCVSEPKTARSKSSAVGQTNAKACSSKAKATREPRGTRRARRYPSAATTATHRSSPRS